MSCGGQVTRWFLVRFFVVAGGFVFFPVYRGVLFFGQDRGVVFLGEQTRRGFLRGAVPEIIHVELCICK